MAVFRYLTHPQVVIDPDVEVPLWGLSAIGRARTENLAASNALRGAKTLVSSGEVKAKETAAPLAKALECEVRVIESSHENDRSATGFLPPNEFQKAADQFFAYPEISFKGWERATDAQARILSAFEKAINASGSGDILMVGHGGVGTLLYCALTNQPISRWYDQDGNGGCLWSYDLETGRMLHGWRSIEAVIRSQDTP